MSRRRKKNTSGRPLVVDYFSELRRAFPDDRPGTGARLDDQTIQLSAEDDACRFEVDYVWNEQDEVEGPLPRSQAMGICRVVSIDRDKRQLTVQPGREFAALILRPLYPQ